MDLAGFLGKLHTDIITVIGDRFLHLAHPGIKRGNLLGVDRRSF